MIDLVIDLGLTRHFLRQVLRGKRLLGLTALASVAGWGVWLTSIGESPSSVTASFHVATATAAGATASIAFLQIGAGLLRDERDAGTLPYLYMKPIERWRLALSAWVAAAGAALLVGAAGWVVGWVATGTQAGSWSLALPALSAYAAAALGYTAVFVPVGYLFSRAFLIGLAYVFVWEGIIGSVFSGLAASSVWRTALSIYADLTELPADALEALGPVAPGLGGGLVKLAATILAGIALLTWALRRRDAL